MKLSVYRSINLPLLPVTRSFSQISSQSTGAYRINSGIEQPIGIRAASKNCAYRHNCRATPSHAEIKMGKNEMDKKDIFIYPATVNDDTIDTAGITDDKNNNPALNAGKNILSSTTLSKASVELPSLATGVYFVRVKNKVPGEATNLRFVNI